ncbi:hypothetical protein U1Q18_018680 [Sarracenia purpurea var. burkii]
MLSSKVPCHEAQSALVFTIYIKFRTALEVDLCSAATMTGSVAKQWWSSGELTVKNLVHYGADGGAR